MGKVSAGNYDINKWLFGGYEQEVITCLYGGPGSGKTNWCMLAAVSQARKKNKVIYIDTEGGFSSERFKQLISSSTKENLSEEEILKNILLLKPTNFIEQQQTFDQLGKYINNQISLIIVDGMTMLYRLEFADARQKDNNLGEKNENIQITNNNLTRQMRQLAEIARKQNIPIIVTNQVYQWENEQRMVGGDILKYWSKCLIEMINIDGKRSAYLRKHRSLKESRFNFQIVNEGIKKRGWI